MIGSQARDSGPKECITLSVAVKAKPYKPTFSFSGIMWMLCSEAFNLWD